MKQTLKQKEVRSEAYATQTIIGVRYWLEGGDKVERCLVTNVALSCAEFVLSNSISLKHI